MSCTSGLSAQLACIFVGECGRRCHCANQYLDNLQRFGWCFVSKLPQYISLQACFTVSSTKHPAQALMTTEYKLCAEIHIIMKCNHANVLNCELQELCPSCACPAAVVCCCQVEKAYISNSNRTMSSSMHLQPNWHATLLPCICMHSVTRSSEPWRCVSRNSSYSCCISYAV